MERFDYTFNGIYKPNAGEPHSWSYYDIPLRFMPCVIYTWLNIPIDIKDNYVTFTLDKTEELIEDESILAYNPCTVFMVRMTPIIFHTKNIILLQ